MLLTGRQPVSLASVRYCDLSSTKGIHKSEHKDFAERIRDLARRFDDEPDETVATVSEQLLVFLKDWLHHHVLVEDMAYRPYVKGRTAREAAKSFRAAEIWWET